MGRWGMRPVAEEEEGVAEEEVVVSAGSAGRGSSLIPAIAAGRTRCTASSGASTQSPAPGSTQQRWARARLLRASSTDAFPHPDPRSALPAGERRVGPQRLSVRRPRGDADPETDPRRAWTVAGRRTKARSRAPPPPPSPSPSHRFRAPRCADAEQQHRVEPDGAVQLHSGQRGPQLLHVRHAQAQIRAHGPQGPRVGSVRAPHHSVNGPHLHTSAPRVTAWTCPTLPPAASS